MADNITTNPGTGGAVLATDDIGGVQYPRTKLVIGADGVNDGDVSAANPMPVQAPALATLAGAVRAEDSPLSKRHASPYRDILETAAELASRDTLDLSESRPSVSDISADIPAPVEARKPAPRQAERPDRLRDILADIRAQESAQGALAESMRGVESQLRAAIAAQDMDEDEAIALVLILAEA